LNEALGLAVGLRPIGSDAHMSQGQAIAGLGEVLRDVARGVVGHHGLDSDTLAGKPGECTLEESHRGAFSLVGQDLDVGEAGGIVDTDVDILPAYTPSPVSLVAGDATPDAPDLAELLDIEVQELAGIAPAIALYGRWWWVQGPEFPKPMVLEDASDRRAWQAQSCRDLGADSALSTQRQDLIRRRVGGLGRHSPRARRAILERFRACLTIASQPLVGRALAQAGSLGCLPERPALLQDPPHQ